MTILNLIFLIWKKDKSPFVMASSTISSSFAFIIVLMEFYRWNIVNDIFIYLSLIAIMAIPVGIIFLKKRYLFLILMSFLPFILLLPQFILSFRFEEAQWNNPGSYSEGFMRVSVSDKDSNKKYGFVDQWGKLVIPCKYGMAGYFSEGYVDVRIDGSLKNGYIDQTGKYVIEPIYVRATSFENVVAYVSTCDSLINHQREWFQIDKKGNEIPDSRLWVDWNKEFY